MTVFNLADRIFSGADEADVVYYGSTMVRELPATQLYVATDGNDTTGNGSIGTPWLTLNKAKTEVAALIAATINENVVVNLRAGEYELTATETFGVTDFDQMHSVTYRSYPGETAVINGSESWATTTWTDEGGGVYSRSLTDQAVFHQLITNGIVATRARWPKDGSFHVMPPFTPAATAAHGMDDYFPYDTSVGDPSATLDIANNPAIEVITYHDFIVDRYRLKEINGSDVILKDSNPWDATDGFTWQNNYGRYYYENAIPFVTAEGEWYYDLANETLYYYPRAGEAINDTVIEIPAINTAIDIQGTRGTMAALADDCTVSLWFNTTGTDARQPLFGNRDFQSTGMEIAVNNDADGAGYIWVRTRGASSTVTANGKVNLNDGEWHHVLVSFDQTNHVAKVVVDGVEPAYKAGNTIASGAGSSKPPQIGKVGGIAYAGLIDEIVVLDKVASASDEAALYARTLDDVSANTVFKMLLNGDFSHNCSEIVGFNSALVFSGFYSAPQFVTGEIGHDPCLEFNGGDDRLSGEGYPNIRIRNLKFQNLTFKYFDRDPLTTYWSHDEGKYKEDMAAVVNMLFAKDCEVTGCTIHSSAGTGIRWKSSEQITASSNTIYDMGYCGIVAQGLDVTFIASKPWENHTIENNEVYRIGQIAKQSHAIWLLALSRTSVKGNYIYEVPGAGIKAFIRADMIYRDMANIVIEQNRLDNCVQELMDNGAIVVHGSCQGGWVHHNNIRNTLRTAYHAYPRSDQTEPVGFIHAIYADSGTEHWTFNYNLINRFATSGIFMKGGRYVTHENNVYVDPEITGLSACFTLNNKPSVYQGDGTTLGYSTPLVSRYNIYYSHAGTESGFGIVVFTAAELATMYAEGGFGTFNFNLFSTDIALVRTGTNTMLTYDLDFVRHDGSLGAIDPAYVYGGLNQETNSIVGNPVFADYDNEDFTVLPASPALLLDFVNFDVPEFP